MLPRFLGLSRGLLLRFGRLGGAGVEWNAVQMPISSEMSIGHPRGPLSGWGFTELCPERLGVRMDPGVYRHLKLGCEPQTTHSPQGQYCPQGGEDSFLGGRNNLLFLFVKEFIFFLIYFY